MQHLVDLPMQQAKEMLPAEEEQQHFLVKHGQSDEKGELKPIYCYGYH